MENSEEDFLYAMKIARKLAAEYIKKNNCSGFKLVINTGQTVGQVVFHTHIHIIPYK
ncbi:HIT family protein [Mycoplasmopsis cynos]|uniref:HIT family protein n=1 Tax=Mycoplasmopsis cynos TaxID=171284 RepID=UPI002FEEFC30